MSKEDAIKVIDQAVRHAHARGAFNDLPPEAVAELVAALVAVKQEDDQ
jgi:NAD dependent epimerase/dehydratase family enzyme